MLGHTSMVVSLIWPRRLIALDIFFLKIQDPLSDRVKPMIPTVAALLAELYPDKKPREWLPVVTIVYMAPGGHRQWPMSISALLDRLS